MVCVVAAEQLTLLNDETERNVAAMAIMHKDAVDRSKGQTSTADVTVTTDGSPTRRISGMSMRSIPIRRNSETAFDLKDMVGDDSFAPKKSGDLADDLIHFLAAQLMCPRVALIASPDTPTSVASNSIATDGSEPTPATFDNPDVQRCAKEKKAIGVDEYGATMFVPILDSKGANVVGVVRCEDKMSAASGRSGARFIKADVAIATIIGGLMCGQSSTKKPSKVLGADATSTSGDDAL
jgi:hypothetical protein